MKLRAQLLKEHTKANCQQIINWVGNSQEKFDDLFFIFLTDEHRVVQRAAWPISYLVLANPKLIRKHFKALIKNIKKPGNPEAVKRNTTRLLQDIEIPEDYQGEIMNLCFEYISSPTEKAATKAFSLTILFNLSKQYPEIKQELRSIIEDRWETETASFHSRARKILKHL